MAGAGLLKDCCCATAAGLLPGALYELQAVGVSKLITRVFATGTPFGLIDSSACGVSFTSVAGDGELAMSLKLIPPFVSWFGPLAGGIVSSDFERLSGSAFLRDLAKRDGSGRIKNETAACTR
jgi:hypothetical protein